jgi:hypothetical protein
MRVLARGVGVVAQNVPEWVMAIMDHDVLLDGLQDH